MVEVLIFFYLIFFPIFLVILATKQEGCMHVLNNIVLTNFSVNKNIKIKIFLFHIIAERY